MIHVTSDIGAPVCVGTVLRGMRTRRGLTQAELAHRLGTTQGAVAKWESGDSVPGTETIHAIGFALGATAEETIALSRVRGNGAPPEGWTDPDSALDQIYRDLRCPRELHEVMFCGFEAEAWRLAARDSRWDSVLLCMLSQRSVQEYFDGRPGLGKPLAMRALRLATKETIRAPIVNALDTAWVAGRRPALDPSSTLQMVDLYSRSLPPSGEHGWALWIGAKALASMGRREEALAATERGIAITPSYGFNPHTHQWMAIGARIETRLALNDPRGALAAIDREPLTGEDYVLCCRVYHANGQAAPEGWMIEAQRRFAEWGGGMWLGRHRFRALEERQSQLVRRNRAFTGPGISTQKY